MIGVDLLVSLIIGLILALLMIPVMGPGRVGWAQFVFFFVLITLMAWVGAAYFRPLGPTIYGAPWLVMLGLAGVFAMFLALMFTLPAHRGGRHVEPAPQRIPHLEDTLPPGSHTAVAATPEDAVSDVLTISFGLIFWLLVLVLLGLILGNYALVGQ